MQRVNVDFTLEILKALDLEAHRLNISRQAVIKTMVSEGLDQRALARGKKEGVVSFPKLLIFSLEMMR